MPKGKSPKHSQTVQAARHSVVDARVLLDRAVSILANMEDSATLIEAVQQAGKALTKLNGRLETEVKFLRWKENKIASGEWRQDMEAACD